MKTYETDPYLFLISLSLSIPFEAKTENEIVADLSQENVEISTNFLGAKILLFGAYDGKKGDDIIVVVTGPKGLVTIQKKEKIFGMWINTKKANYINTPKYFSISSNRPIDEILNKKNLFKNGGSLFPVSKSRPQNEISCVNYS